jgi:hypothetical protein
MTLHVAPLAVFAFHNPSTTVGTERRRFSLFVSPTIGAVIYLLKNQKFSLSGLILAYLNAMFPLGFWAG